MEKKQEVEAGNGEGVEESNSLKDGSICGYESLHSLLSANLKPEIFQVINFFFSPPFFH
jgi:beta-ureidopropionase